MICPCCNSTNVRQQIVKEAVSIFGTTVHYDAILNTCLTCKEQGDFENANQEVIEKAVKAAKEIYVAENLVSLESGGFSQQSIERELYLPIGSLSNNTDMTAALLFVIMHSALFVTGEIDE